jgi:hypothetical protein
MGRSPVEWGVRRGRFFAGQIVAQIKSSQPRRQAEQFTKLLPIPMPIATRSRRIHEKEFAMRLTFILPVALLGLVSAAPLASADMLSVPTPKLQSAIQPNGILTVADKQMQTAANDVHLRSKPSASSTRLATLKIGTPVDVLQLVDNNTWAQVKYGTKTGYIRADLLK